MTKLRGAVIGCGYVSQFHLEAWLRVANAQLVAVCDTDRPRVEWAQRAGARGTMLHRGRRTV